MDPLRLPSLLGRKTLIATFAASAVLGLSGCATIKVHLGMRVYLAKTPVASIEVSQPRGPGIAPGQKSPLMVTLTEPDGKILLTEGAGHGKVMWSDLAVTGSLVTVDKKGSIRLPHDPRKTEGKLPHIAVTVPSHPDLHAELDIPLRYDYPFVSDFSGSAGSNGFNGTDGSAGSAGSSGSTDPNNPSPGGNGSNGGDGSNGQDGDNGGDAPAVEVHVTLRPGDHPLLQALVTGAGHQRYFLIDPQGGSLNVRADGGPGGAGGKGGRGGQGGSGGLGSPSGSSGSNGSDGRNGSDGSMGRGGLITVTYDPSAQPYISSIHPSSQNGPKAVFVQQQVAPLW